MPTIKKQIEEATDAELREFAAGTLQLELDEKVKSRSQLLAEIGKAWKNPFVIVDVGDLPEGIDHAGEIKPERQAAKLNLGKRYQDDPIVVVEINSTSYPGGGDPVPVCVNGTQVVIQREMPVELPYRFYLALKDAHEVHITQDPKTLKFNERRTTNFPMSVTKFPAQGEVDAWFERTKDDVLG